MRLLTTREVAAKLNVSPRTVTNWIRADRLPYVRLPGGEYRVPLEGLLGALSGSVDLRRQLEAELAEAGRRDDELSESMSARLARLHELSRQMSAIAGKAAPR